MFGVPAAPLAERGTEGHAVLGPDVSSLHERLGNVTSFARRVEFLNTYFLEQLTRKNRPVVSQGFQSLLQNNYGASVAQVARQTGMSLRQFERKSLDYFGLPPITLNRIARFQRALNIGMSQETSWLKVAHEADYYDQMHMIRDFRVFAGGPPTKALASIESHHLIRF